MKCNCCDNNAEYIFTECDSEVHLCDKCAISHFSLYPMRHYECNNVVSHALMTLMKKMASTTFALQNALQSSALIFTMIKTVCYLFKSVYITKTIIIRGEQCILIIIH